MLSFMYCHPASTFQNIPEIRSGKQMLRLFILNYLERKGWILSEAHDLAETSQKQIVISKVIITQSDKGYSCIYLVFDLC